MKIVHTSDWHVGRRWKGILRLDEVEAVFEHLARFIERERVDLVLHTGDVFDGRNPPAEAERLVNELFVRVGHAGAQMVVIAGNHDDPQRLDARAQLAELTAVRLVGRPRREAMVLETRGGERAVIAALPFASPSTWAAALGITEVPAAAGGKYARTFAAAAGALAAGFRADAVNLFLGHTHVAGASFGDSERRVHTGEEWSAPPEALPAAASYVALGHLHAPQAAPGPAPAHFAGSALEMDFGEAGQEKSFVFVTAAPGQPATIERVPYEGGAPLIDVRAPLAEVPALAEQYPRGWLRVTVPLEARDPDIARKVRDVVPHALVVRAEVKSKERPAPPRPPEGAPPGAHYAAYHQREHGRAAEPELLETFEALYAAASGTEG